MTPTRHGRAIPLLAVAAVAVLGYAIFGAQEERSFTTVAELREALEEAGVACGQYAEQAVQPDEPWRQQATCTRAQPRQPCPPPAEAGCGWQTSTIMTLTVLDPERMPDGYYHEARVQGSADPVTVHGKTFEIDLDRSDAPRAVLATGGKIRGE